MNLGKKIFKKRAARIIILPAIFIASLLLAVVILECIFAVILGDDFFQWGVDSAKGFRLVAQGGMGVFDDPHRLGLRRNTRLPKL